MLKQERHDKITDLIQKEKKVNVVHLSKELGVTEMTIRRDLTELEETGLLSKVYGGALLRSEEKSGNESTLTPYDLKLKSIAEAALNCIEDHDTIFLGSGNTCCYLAKLLNRRKNISVVTNNISALGDLYKNVTKIFLIGGEIASVDGKTLFSSIEDPTTYLKDVYVVKSFVSATGVDLQAGITVDTTVSTYIYKYISSINRNTYLLVNGEKFGRTGFYRVAEIEDLKCVIADKVPEEFQHYFSQKGILTITTDERTKTLE